MPLIILSTGRLGPDAAGNPALETGSWRFCYNPVMDASDPAGTGRFQETRWGNFTWLREPSDPGRGRLSIAMTRFNPGAHQPPHRHASEEQLIYVISGGGTSVYDGETTNLAPGTISHMHAHGIHEVWASQSGLEMLMVFVPAPVDVPAVPRGRLGFDRSILGSVLAEQMILEYVRRLGSLLDMGIALADPAGRMLIEPVNAPPECVSKCFLRARGPWKALGQVNQDTIIECCPGNYFVAVPVLESTTGELSPLYLFAGPVNLGPERAVPRSRLYTAAEATQTLANLIETVAKQKEQELVMAAQMLSIGLPKDQRVEQSLSPYPAIQNRAVSRVVSLLHKNPDRRINLDEASRVAGLNPSHLSRVFRRDMGMNFVRYATFVKMARAKALLVTTDLTVKEIADRLGFSSSAYFGQVFRRLEGTTPRSYRVSSKNL
ncbi:MAG: AraC family transcriptional regulator [Firmicutes bacterium]|nr:AraC family transcriptional regulator [Bacillota bacterium]